MPLAHRVPGQPDVAEKSPSLGPHAAVDCSELFRAFKTETKMFCLGKFPLKQRRHPPHLLCLVLSWAAGLCLGLQPARWSPQVCAVCGREAVRWQSEYWRWPHVPLLWDFAPAPPRPSSPFLRLPVPRTCPRPATLRPCGAALCWEARSMSRPWFLLVFHH